MPKYEINIVIEDEDDDKLDEINHNFFNFMGDCPMNYDMKIRKIKEEVKETDDEETDGYMGITHGIPDKMLSDPSFLEIWGRGRCSQGLHAFDEVWSGDDDHYLSCDVCGMKVHISKIEK